MHKTMAMLAMIGLSSACAGRAPAPVAVVQPMDNSFTCSAMMAEISSNNGRITDLGSEKGAKVAQNVAASVVGLVVWPVWFLMDFQGAAGTEIKALQDRNYYLATKANDDGCSAPSQTTTARAAPMPAPYAPPTNAYVGPAPAPTYAAPAYAPAPAYTPPTPPPVHAPQVASPSATVPAYAPPAVARAYAPPPVGAYRPDPYVVDAVAPGVAAPTPIPPGGDPYAIDPYAIDPAPAAAPGSSTGDQIPAWMAPL